MTRTTVGRIDSYNERPHPRLVRLVAATMIVLGFGASWATAQPVSSARIDVPAVPPNLEVPAGHDVFLAGQAEGTQNYICLPAGKKDVAWRFVGPQATLFHTLNGDVREQITTHFLSVNPSEGAVTRPTWQHSIDSSRVWGRVIASSSDPNIVAPGAIAWLLLEVAGVDRGPTGGVVLAETTFIHRLNTSGGIAPSTGCSDVSQIGTLALVPYTTDYFFYRPTR